MIKPPSAARVGIITCPFRIEKSRFADWVSDELFSPVKESW
jgi:hypothetical protein